MAVCKFQHSTIRDDGDANEGCVAQPITLGDVPLMETALASCTTPFKIKVKYQMD